MKLTPQKASMELQKWSFPNDPNAKAIRGVLRVVNSPQLWLWDVVGETSGWDLGDTSINDTSIGS